MVRGDRKSSGEISDLQRFESAPSGRGTMKIEVDGNQLAKEIEDLAKISDAEPPVVTRIVFTPADLKARAWIKARCEAAGLAVREDAIGNSFARWIGSDPNASMVGTGSHIDAIPNAGKFDGVVGVLGGLEAIRALQRVGFHPRRSIELLIFTSEEPTRFGIGCLGSRLLSGTLSAEDASKLTDKNGASVDEVRKEAGFTGELRDVKLPPNYYKAFVELHIEQGPILECERMPVGVVERIAAPASLMITVEGSGGHAGAVLMSDRKDALCAAAEFILAV
jgi:ureidoglycolate amidohydrolase